MTPRPAAASTSSAVAARSSRRGTATACPRRDFPMLIDLYLQGRLTCEASSARRSASATSRRLSRRCTRRGPSLGRHGGPMSARIDHVVTSGMFSLDGEDFDVDNNVWLVGDDAEVLVVDAAHDAASDPGARRGPHGRGDRLHPRRTTTTSTRRASSPTRQARRCSLHPDDRMLWDVVHPDRDPLAAGRRRHRRGRGHDAAGAAHARALARRRSASTPPELGRAVLRRHAVPRRPGATGRSYSDFPTILDSIRERLLTLPAGDACAHRAR